MVHIPFQILFLLLFKTYFSASKLHLYIPESINLLNCQCNNFWPCIAFKIAAFLNKECSYKNDCGIQLDDADLEHSPTKESHERKKNWSPYVLVPIFMFWHSRFSFRNFKDANLCMFSWCITTSTLSVCSWHDISLSQSVQYLQ